MDFWRGEAYSAFFDYLDSTGNFYYEVGPLVLFAWSVFNASQRWGDAPVHSIGAALFARADQMHFFNEIGYEHNPYTHCPTGDAWTRGKCACGPEKSFGQFSAFSYPSCMY